MNSISKLYNFFSTLSPSDFDTNTLLLTDENLTIQRIPKTLSAKKAVPHFQGLSRAILSLDQISKNHQGFEEQAQLQFVKTILTHIQLGIDTSLKRWSCILKLEKIVDAKDPKSCSFGKALVQDMRDKYFKLGRETKKSFTDEIGKAISLVSHCEEKKPCKKETREEKITGINDIPPEVLVHVFSYLPLNDLSFSQRVCKSWKSVASDNLCILNSIQITPKCCNLFSKSEPVIDQVKKAIRLQKTLPSKLFERLKFSIENAVFMSCNDKIILSGRSIRNQHKCIVLINDTKPKKFEELDVESYRTPKGITFYHEEKLITIDQDLVLHFTDIHNKETDPRKSIALLIETSAISNSYFYNNHIFLIIDKTLYKINPSNGSIIHSIAIADDEATKFFENGWLVCKRENKNLTCFSQKQIELPYSEDLKPIHVSKDNFLFCITKMNNIKVFDLMNEKNPEIGIINCQNILNTPIGVIAYSTGIVYIYSDKKVHAVNAFSGEKIKSFNTYEPIRSMFCSDKHLYLKNSNNIIIALI